MNKRLITYIGKLSRISPVKHYIGLPPILSDEDNNREELPHPNILIIEEKPDGVFLYRYTFKGYCINDTWHINIEDAKDQAKYEYGKSINKWVEVPNDYDDPIAFMLKKIHDKGKKIDL